MAPRIIFFDLETRLWAKDLRPDDEEAGWEDLRSGKGGASAIALYDTRDMWLYLYDDHTIENAARHLEAADIVVGYNSERFDLPCIEGLTHRRLRIRRHIDIYRLLVQEYARRGITGQKGDFTLDTISKKNLGRGKIAQGAHAKELAAKGHWGKLFNYCASDVLLTRYLYYRVCRDGGLISLGGSFISLPLPEHLKLRAEDIPS